MVYIVIREYNEDNQGISQYKVLPGCITKEQAEKRVADEQIEFKQILDDYYERKSSSSITWKIFEVNTEETNLIMEFNNPEQKRDTWSLVNTFREADFFRNQKP
jgi:hypothetical protein